MGVARLLVSLYEGLPSLAAWWTCYACASLHTCLGSGAPQILLSISRKFDARRVTRVRGPHDPVHNGRNELLTRGVTLEGYRGEQLQK